MPTGNSNHPTAFLKERWDRAAVVSTNLARRGDEVWLWQGGGPMMLTVDETAHAVGPDRRAGQELQVLVPAGAWQSATPATDDWSLVACVVAPDFDFADFELR